ncbi:MAG: hypothetical protein II739_02390 [Clostridia bacterium]|nr:hypothetical protein [Clostridia bacterium]
MAQIDYRYGRSGLCPSARPVPPAVELYRNERLGIAGATCGEIARLTVAELEAEFGPAEIKRSLRSFVSSLRTSVEQAALWGEVVFKPFFDGSRGVGAQCLTPDCYTLDRFGPDGTPAEAEFRSEIRCGDRVYARTERHVLEGGKCTVTNSVRVHELRTGRSYQGRLSDLPEWEPLSPKVVFENVSRPLFAVFSLPAGADGDGRGEPVFSRGIKLIMECEKQLDRLLWEYEGGELAIDASYDAFRTGRDGKPELPRGNERLWRTNMLDSCSSQSELMKIFAPQLRDGSYLRGLNRLLMHYEDAVGLSRGTFSDPVAEPRTAAEILSTERRTFSLVADVRRALIRALGDLCGALSDVCRLYGLGTRCSLAVKCGDGVTEAGDETNAEYAESADETGGPAEIALGRFRRALTGEGRI